MFGSFTEPFNCIGMLKTTTFINDRPLSYGGPEIQRNTIHTRRRLKKIDDEKLGSAKWDTYCAKHVISLATSTSRSSCSASRAMLLYRRNATNAYTATVNINVDNGEVSASGMGDCLRVGKLSHYVTSHPGQLSLAIPPWVGAMSTGDGYGHR